MKNNLIQVRSLESCLQKELKNHQERQNQVQKSNQNEISRLIQIKHDLEETIKYRKDRIYLLNTEMPRERKFE